LDEKDAEILNFVETGEYAICIIDLGGDRCPWMDGQKVRQTAETSWLQETVRSYILQKIGNDNIRQSLGIQTTLLDKVVQRRLRWFGHGERMPVDLIPHKCTMC